jgi:hypothetical protein
MAGPRPWAGPSRARRCSSRERWRGKTQAGWPGATRATSWATLASGAGGEAAECVCGRDGRQYNTRLLGYPAGSLGLGRASAGPGQCVLSGLSVLNLCMHVKPLVCQTSGVEPRWPTTLTLATTDSSCTFSLAGAAALSGVCAPARGGRQSQTHALLSKGIKAG